MALADGRSVVVKFSNFRVWIFDEESSGMKYPVVFRLTEEITLVSLNTTGYRRTDHRTPEITQLSNEDTMNCVYTNVDALVPLLITHLTRRSCIPFRNAEQRVKAANVAELNVTRGSAMAQGLRDALVSRNSATTKYPYRVALFA